MKDLFTAVVFLCILCLAVLSYYVMSNKRLGIEERAGVIRTYGLLMLASIFNWAGIVLNGLTDHRWYYTVHWLAKAFEHSLGPMLFILFANFVGKHFVRKILWGVFSVNVLVQFLSIYNKLGFYIDSANIYHRGKWGSIVYICSALGFIYATYIYTKAAKTYKYKNNVVLGLIGILELFSITIHIFDENVDVDYIGTMIVMVLIYIYLDDFKKQQQDEMINTQLKITQALIMDYEGVYDVNLETRYFEMLRMSEEMQKQLGERFKWDTKYEVGINAYCKLNVYHQDVDMFKENSRLDVILKELETKQAYVFEYRVIKPDQVRYYSMRCVKCVEGDGQTHLILAFRDVDDQKVRWEKLVRISNTDQMTGLYNRRAYNEALDKADDMSPFDRSNLTVIMIDLNNLKGINDTIGHEAGDELIIAAAKFFLDSFKNNCSVFRLGGDEFVVLGRMSKNECMRSIEGLKEKMLGWKGRLVDAMSASIGYARADEGDDFIKCEELVKIADSRMYDDKRSYYETHDRRR